MQLLTKILPPPITPSFTQNGVKSKGYNRFLLLLLLVLVSFTSKSEVYYISNSGNDSNNGTSENQAWRTLAKVNSFIPSPGDKILFKRDDEWTGTLEVKSSGFPQKPIVYGAYGSGEKPKLYGSKQVNGWKQYTGNIYQTTFSDPAINQVFIDGKRAKSARYPNTGYLDINQVNGKNSFTSAQLENGINYTGSTVILRAREWSISTKQVTASSGNSITINSAPLYDLNIGEGFVLFDKLKFIDEPGEWFYDKSTSTLYLWAPSGDSPENYEVRASTVKNGLFADAKKYVTVENLEFLHYSVEAFSLNDCSYFTIRDNNVLWPDGRGIYLGSKSSGNCTFQNNIIKGANHEGMHIIGESHSILDNSIEDINLFENIGISGVGNPLGGRGIYIEYGKNNVIRHNKLKNIGYNGIQMFDAPHTLIEYNVVKNACLTKEDGGGIYCFNTKETNPGCEYSEIRGNIVDNVVGNKDGYTAKIRQGSGIYIDDRIHHITVENNTVAGCSLHGIYLHNNKYVTVKNNLLFNNGSGYRVTADYNAKNNIIKNNIIVNIVTSHYTDADAMLSMLDSRESRIVQIDENTYVDHHRSKPFRDMRNYSYVTFEGWQSATGQDRNSTFENSGLKNEEKEKLFYNETNQTIKVQLGNSIYNDIFGNRISGSVVLQPFESVVLIGKQLENVNQAPVITGQSFNIRSPTEDNEVIGKVLAFDNDVGQQVHFSIVKGSQNGLFSINPVTGEIHAHSPFQPNSNQLFELTIGATDDAPDPLTSTAIINVSLSIPGEDLELDTEPPLVTSFIIPANSRSLTVPITELDATDNEGVTGFFFSESVSKPSPTNLSWFSSPLPRFVFSYEGSHTLYVWVKDAAGNVSEHGSASVNISFERMVILPDSTETIQICEGDEFLGWSESGKYERTKTTGQDTVQKIITHLTVTPLKYFTENKTINEGESYYDWTESGVYERTLSAANGCDSIITTNLTVIHTTKEEEFVSICEGEEYMGWTESGVYRKDTVVNSDTVKVAITTLTVISIQYSTEEITISSGNQYLGWDESGEYQRILTSSQGCDSIVTTHLTVLQPATTIEDITICKGEQYNGWKSTGKYQRILKTPNGADSIVNTNLWVMPNYEISEEVAISANESYYGWTETGEYTRVLTSAAGCDSTVITNLTVKAIPPDTSDSYISYEDWSTNLRDARNVIRKDTVLQRKNIDIKSDFLANSLKVYPNPATSFINVDYVFMPQFSTQIQLIDLNGKVLFTHELKSKDSKIHLEGIPDGIYFLSSKNMHWQAVKKVIKK